MDVLWQLSARPGLPGSEGNGRIGATAAGPSTIGRVRSWAVRRQSPDRQAATAQRREAPLLDSPLRGGGDLGLAEAFEIADDVGPFEIVAGGEEAILQLLAQDAIERPVGLLSERRRAHAGFANAWAEELSSLMR